jgi:hypothetical protein
VASVWCVEQGFVWRVCVVDSKGLCLVCVVESQRSCDYSML